MTNQQTLKNRTIFCRDNLDIMRGINDNSIDLIYLDPPFNKKKEFSAPIGRSAEGASFKDVFRKDDVKEEWLGLIADQYPVLYEYLNGIGNIDHKSNKYYLCYMAVRLMEMRRILKPTGSIYLHCDQTMSHYLKLLLDCVFGGDNFQNEIIWSYKTGGTSSKRFSKKHEAIFFYSNSNNYTFNPLKEKSYTKSTSRKAGIHNYGQANAQFWEDDRGVYNMVNMRDVWEISYISSTSKERSGYPTQKPLVLMERIIEASSNKGDVILDPFCGCATTCVAAEKLERKWVGIDISEMAYKLVNERIRAEVPEDLFRGQAIFRKDMPQRTDNIQSKINLDDEKSQKQYLYGIQNGNCKGCNLHFHFKNMTRDHITSKANGGGDDINNLMLLCNYCNSVKNKNKNLEELKVILKARGFLEKRM